MNEERIAIRFDDYNRLLREEETLNTLVNIIKNVDSFNVRPAIKAAFPGLLDSEEPVPNA